MKHAHSVGQVRAAEAALMAELPEGTLMQRAAYGLAAVCREVMGRTYGQHVVLLVGTGDNGGDALYAGALLARRGALVEAVLLDPDRTHEDGLHAFLRANGRVVTSVRHDADLVVDGITGIGGRGGLRPEAEKLLDAIKNVPVISVDLPSGVDADTGEVAGQAVKADVTVAFGTYKPGLLIDPGATYAGDVRLVDIGLKNLPEPVLSVAEDVDVAALLPTPTGESDKYKRGVVGVCAGSTRYPGAARLAVGSALRGGAGAVRFSGPPHVVDAVLAEHPETLASSGGPAGAGRVQAWVVGPGLDTVSSSKERFAEVLDAGVPVLIDADGLTLLADKGPQALSRTPFALLTPHAGEAVRLLDALGVKADRDEVEQRRLHFARELAAGYDATVLLKGSTTVIADPQGRTRVNTTGSPWLATAGSGDVLSGLAGSLMAAGLSPFDAATAAAHLHGLAGQRAARGAPITALDLITAIPAVWRAVRESAAGAA